MTSLRLSPTSNSISRPIAPAAIKRDQLMKMPIPFMRSFNSLLESFVGTAHVVASCQKVGRGRPGLPSHRAVDRNAFLESARWGQRCPTAGAGHARALQPGVPAYLQRMFKGLRLGIAKLGSAGCITA